MKLRSRFAMIPILLGMLILPALCQGTEVWGVFFTYGCGGAIAATEYNGVLVPNYFNLSSGDLLTYWEINFDDFTSMTVTMDSHKNLHAVVKAITLFTNDHYTQEFSNAEADITVPVTGPQTVGVRITDYFHPKTILYSSGTTASGAILQLPLTQGSFSLVP